MQLNYLKRLSYIKKIWAKFREPVSGLTHLGGALAAAVGLVLLLIKGIKTGNTWAIAGFLIFGISMILLYTSSALYHLLKVSESAILNLKKLDHSMIYVLIAGTYTPICLAGLEGFWRWGPFIIIWGLALAGIAAKLMWINTPVWLSNTFYLIMGWVGIFLFPKLFSLLPSSFIIWLITGGLFYTIGAFIYGLKRPDPFPNVFGHHEIWHLFVLAGTFSHFWAIYAYIPESA